MLSCSLSVTTPSPFICCQYQYSDCGLTHCVEIKKQYSNDRSVRAWSFRVTWNWVINKRWHIVFEKTAIWFHYMGLYVHHYRFTLTTPHTPPRALLNIFSANYCRNVLMKHDIFAAGCFKLNKRQFSTHQVCFVSLWKQRFPTKETQPIPNTWP